MKQIYKLEASVWLYPGKSSWHFLSIPPDITSDIDFYFSMNKRGWGSLPVLVKIGETEWQTSIFPDKKTNTYLLPLKKEVRKKEDILAGQKVSVQVVIES